MPRRFADILNYVRELSSLRLMSRLSHRPKCSWSSGKIGGRQQTLYWLACVKANSESPLAQAIFVPPPPPNSFDGQLLVKAHYSAHVLGAELSVEALPMTQQDSRIGACAQAAVWVSARHFHTRHRGPWLSTVSIMEAAIANAEHAINVSLPAGSKFLTGNNIVAALRAAAREPLLYHAKAGSPPDWGGIRPTDVISRYVDSGIPVLLGIEFSGQPIGHAVVVSGHVMRDSPRAALPRRPSLGEYCEAFYVNDDQLGPKCQNSGPGGQRHWGDAIQYHGACTLAHDSSPRKGVSASRECRSNRVECAR